MFQTFLGILKSDLCQSDDLHDQGLKPFWSQLSSLPKTSNISVDYLKTKQLPEAVHAALIQHLDHLKARASALEIDAHGQPHQQQAQDLLRMLDTLMGDVVEPRKRFIEDNALNVRNLDV